MLTLKEWSLSKKPRLPFTFQIGTTDRVFTAEEQRNTLKRGPIRRSKLSKVELAVALESWKPSGEGLAVENMWNSRFADEEGNFYRYWSTKEGITIIKWYKQ